MKRNKHILLFIAILFIVSVVIGYIYGVNNFYDLTDYLANLDKHNSFFLAHIIIFLVFLFSTISLLGIFVESIYIGFEGISVGYLLATFYANFKINGILYGLITVLVNKVFFLIIITYLFLVTFNYIKKSAQNIIGLNKDYFSYLIKPLFFKYGIILVFILIYDIIIYLFGNTLLNYLTFML